MTRDRPLLWPGWLWLGRNALWIVVPLIALLVFGRGMTSETAPLWLGPFVGLGVFWVKYIVWHERRHETAAERASREANAEGGMKLWSMKVDSAGTTLGESVAILVQMAIGLVLAIGVVYVVLHFVVKYW